MGPNRSQRADAPEVTPLRPGERAIALVIAAAVAALLAVAVAIGTFTVHGARRHGAFVPGGIFLTVLLLSLAVGMLRRRYWAVLGFEALLVLQILAAAFGIVFASGNLTALGWLCAMSAGGVLFWKLVRVMARVQARELELARAGVAAQSASEGRSSGVAPGSAAAAEAGVPPAVADSPERAGRAALR